MQVMVPDVSNVMLSSWAMPCAPVAGMQHGQFALPPIGSNGVWVEFEQGDPDYPIWVGCFWGTAAEVPALARTVPPTVPGHHAADRAAERHRDQRRARPDRRDHAQERSGATLIVNDTGIYIQNGKGASIVMVGPTVTVNAGALVIT
jgi:uncharacterized protein involved in type VI secretion and phage assembly